MKIIKTINMRGDFILQTRKNQMAFKSEKGEALEFACLQAQALARFFEGNGRFLVSETSANSALVQYDPSPVRDGVEEEFAFCAFQNANSGTVSWREARTFNLMEV